MIQLKEGDLFIGVLFENDTEEFCEAQVIHSSEPSNAVEMLNQFLVGLFIVARDNNMTVEQVVDLVREGFVMCEGCMRPSDDLH